MPEMSFTPGHRSDLLLSKPGAVGRQGQEGTRERSQVSGSLKLRGANWEKARRRESPGGANRPRRSPLQLADSLGTSPLGRRLQRRIGNKPSGKGKPGGGGTRTATLLCNSLKKQRPFGANCSPKGRTFLGVGTDCPTLYGGFPPADMPFPSPQGQVST